MMHGRLRGGRSVGVIDLVLVFGAWLPLPWPYTATQDPTGKSPSRCWSMGSWKHFRWIVATS